MPPILYFKSRPARLVLNFSHCPLRFHAYSYFGLDMGEKHSGKETRISLWLDCDPGQRLLSSSSSSSINLSQGTM